ncbi:hypothetical protein FACS189449_12900 [Alphaproteobacteria bacterium]|nr:hypothetical protein FACS189449_12900 [Alphaproteobacteria bacterium]
MTYAKEPVFGAIAIIALTNFIFRYEELSKKDRVFNCALLFNSAMFVGIYAYRRFRKPIEHLYANCFSNSYFDSTSALFNTDPLLYFFVIVFVIRLYFVLVKKDSAHLLLDGLLFAAIGYTIAYVLLGIASDYYIFPSMVLAIPSLAYWTSCLFKRNKPIATLILLISIFLVKDSAMTSKNIAVDILSHRKTDMPIVRRIVNQYLKGSEIVVFTESSTYESYIWNIYVYNNFINYCLGHKANILKKCSNPDDIPPNSLILCCKTSNPIFLKLDRFKIFHLVEKNALGMDIYISKNIAWEK